MNVIIGLGNPGIRYNATRHNIGFAIVKALAKSCKFDFRREAETSALVAKGRLKNQSLVLALPLTYMNLSGLTVVALVRKYKIEYSQLLVVCDDIDLAFGRIKMKASGSAGGHRGLTSIIELLESDQFARLRVGVARPHPAVDVSEYVLAPFLKTEKEQLPEVVARARDCCLMWMSDGIQKSKNVFNKSASPTPSGL